MTASFVHVDRPVEHPGIQRAARVSNWLINLPQSFDGTRATATMLLAAIVAALVVVANQVVDTWTEGHLLAAWIVLWTVAFAALGLLATPMKHASRALRVRSQLWAARRRQTAADAQLWNVALQDARVMADISRAMSAAAVHDVKRFG